MASNPSKNKGSRAESLVKETLTQYTGLNWQRTPLSGALDAKHGLKSDLYIPNEKNVFAVEVKHYADSQINHLLLSGTSPTLIEWWEQTVRQGIQTSKKPLLVFKHDRSKLYAAFSEEPTQLYNYIMISRDAYIIYVSMLEDWLKYETPKFVT